LVTGASGFIGSHLLRRLRGTPVDLHAASRQVPGDQADGVRWWRADLTEATAVRQLVRDIRPQVIIHLASHVAGARDLALVQPTFGSNLVSTVNLLTAAADVGCRRMLLTGSLEEPTEADGVPCSPYAAAKQAASNYGRMFHALFALPVAVLRLFMVYGPGQHDVRKLIPYVILSLLRGEPPRLMSGRREVDWVFVEDVVDALLAAAVAPAIDGGILDVGSGKLVTVKDVVDRLVTLVNPRIEPSFGAIADRPLEQVRVADTARTAALINWNASTSLEDGLTRTVDWYAERFAAKIRHP
jgi:nucleoside-diphosphate-sugar epimerase